MSTIPPIPPREIALENREEISERLFSPSTARNRDAIRDVYLKHMPLSGTILEVGAGTGEHAAHLAKALPETQWYTGDPDPASRASIAAWITHEKIRTLHGPHAIDVSLDDWKTKGLYGTHAKLDGLVSINMVHIAPFKAAKGLFAGAKRLLRPGGKLFLYGPFKRNGVHTAPSNEAFDQNLKSRNPLWGIRDIEHDLVPLAHENTLTLEQVIAMPANNFVAIFQKPKQA